MRFDPDFPSPTLQASGAELLVRTLVELGVDTVFGYPGGAVLPLYDALFGEPRLRHVLVRHEQAAVHAAEGYARCTGRLGVVIVTSGPGVANTVSGLLDAQSDSLPVLCISGQVARAAIGTQAFQECDALAITRSVTKWQAQAREAAQIPALLREAVDVGRLDNVIEGALAINLLVDAGVAPHVIGKAEKDVGALCRIGMEAGARAEKG